MISVIFPEQSSVDSTRKKIGLVLSGGGALGFAHIGILQAIDSLNIPIDYVAGTSMGGIAGGLYALGYNGNSIEGIAKSIDWIDIFNDRPKRNLRSYFQKKDDGKYQFSFAYKKGNITIPSGLVHGQKISMLLANMTNKFEHIENFDDLPIPYRCVAVDLITGNEIILKEGSISKALRSTMSIPSAFNPVQWGDSLLVDGGLLNNLPVDVVRDMGADIVIAVNVSITTNPASNLNSALGVLERSITIPASNRSNKNIKDVDVYIEPELEGYTGADFVDRRINKIIEIGQKAAAKAIPELIEICNKNNINIDIHNYNEPRIIRRFHVDNNSRIETQKILKNLNIRSGDTFSMSHLQKNIASLRLINNHINIEYDIVDVNEHDVDILISITDTIEPSIYRISIRGNETIPFSFIYRFLGINPSKDLDIDLLNQRIDELYGLGYFETITYEIEPIDENSIHLIIIIKEASESTIRLGFTYDETYKYIGKVQFVSTRAIIPGLRFEGNMSFSGIFDLGAKLYYPVRLDDLSIYPYLQVYGKDIPLDIYGTDGNRIALYNDRSIYWSAGLGFLSSKNWATEVEINNEVIDLSPEVVAHEVTYPSWNETIRSVRLNSTLDTRDDVIIPRRGILLNFEYENSTEIINTDTTYSKYELNLDYYHSIGKRNTIRVFTKFGYSEEDLPVYKWFFSGGPNEFVGTDMNELVYYRTSIFGMNYRFKIRDNLYLKALYNIIPNYDGNFYPNEAGMINGFGFGVKYVTLLGPLEVIAGRGDRVGSSSSSGMKNVLYFRLGFHF